MKLTKSNKATIAGYLMAIYGATMVLDLDTLDYSLPSTYVKLFGAIIMPILAGHSTQLKGTDLNDKAA